MRFKVFLIIFLLSPIVMAARAALVVQFDKDNVIKKCLNFTNGQTAADLLFNSNFSLSLKNYPGMGLALCGINGIGCDTYNCFCDPTKYWIFYYISNNVWAYSEVGISSHVMKDMDVIGFLWGAYGDVPDLYSFESICKPATTINIGTSGNCIGRPVKIDIRSGDGSIIWTPTPFTTYDQATGDMKIKSMNGTLVKILHHQFSPDNKETGLEMISITESDETGMITFLPDRFGIYTIIVEKEGFIPETADISIKYCDKVNFTIISSLGNETSSLEYVNRTYNRSDIELTRVDVQAPKFAKLGQAVVVELLDKNGERVKNVEVIITAPGGREFNLTSSEDGGISFIPDEEGVYSYSLLNRLVSSYEVTNVIRPTLTSFAEKIPNSFNNETSSPIIAQATSKGNDNVLYAFVILISIGFYLYFLKNQKW